MKVLIVYESFFGNTEKIAQAIKDGFGPDAQLAQADQIKQEQLKELDLIIVGSPTRAFRPTEKTKKFLSDIPAGILKGVKATAFDTGFSKDDTKSGFLRLMIKMFGYAGKPIATSLQKKGAEVITEPEEFWVTDIKGPLKEGEIERAKGWASKILERLK